MWPEFVDDGLNPQHEELVSQMNPELKAGLRIIKKTLIELDRTVGVYK